MSGQVRLPLVVIHVNTRLWVSIYNAINQLQYDLYAHNNYYMIVQRRLVTSFTVQIDIFRSVTIIYPSTDATGNR